LRTSTVSLSRIALLFLVIIVGKSHAGANDYFAGLSKVGGAELPQYLLILAAGIAIFSFVIVLAKPTIGIMLAMLLFPFVTEDAEMTITKLLASVVTFGFFVAWLASKIALYSAHRGERDYLGCERALMLFLVYLGINGIYAKMAGISPVDIIRDLVSLSNLLLFLIIKRFVRSTEGVTLLERFQFVLMVIFGLELTLITAAHASMVIRFLPISMSALQILGLFITCMVGLICFNGSRPLLMVTGAIPTIYLVTTSNRTQFIAAILGIGFVMLVTKATRAKIAFSFFVIVILLTGLILAEKYRPASFESKLAKLQRIQDAGSDLAIEDRIGEAKQCFGLFQSSPFLGKGAGYTYHLSRKYVQGMGTNVVLDTNFTHSDLMFMLSKFGIIGVVLFFWFYFKISKLSWLVWKNASSARVRAKGLICFLILISAFLMCQSTPFLQSRIDAFFLSLVMGYAYCLYRFNIAGQESEPVYENEPVIRLTPAPVYSRLYSENRGA
jgi:hypothetical protein